MIAGLCLVLLVGWFLLRASRFRRNHGWGVAPTPPPVTAVVLPARGRDVPSVFRLRGPQGGM